MAENQPSVVLPTMLHCKQCGRPCQSTDSGPVRSCEHTDAPIVAYMAAHATSQGTCGVKRET